MSVTSTVPDWSKSSTQNVVSVHVTDTVPEPVEIPEKEDLPYVRPPFKEQSFVPQIY